MSYFGAAARPGWRWSDNGSKAVYVPQHEFLSGMAMWLKHVQEGIAKSTKDKDSKKGQKPIEQ